MLFSQTKWAKVIAIKKGVGGMDCHSRYGWNWNITNIWILVLHSVKHGYDTWHGICMTRLLGHNNFKKNIGYMVMIHCKITSELHWHFLRFNVITSDIPLFCYIILTSLISYKRPSSEFWVTEFRAKPVF